MSRDCICITYVHFDVFMLKLWRYMKWHVGCSVSICKHACIRSFPWLRSAIAKAQIVQPICYSFGSRPKLCAFPMLLRYIEKIKPINYIQKWLMYFFPQVLSFLIVAVTVINCVYCALQLFVLKIRVSCYFYSVANDHWERCTNIPNLIIFSRNK